jgi:multicomponent Na+:H+ antiporter subunit B
MIAMNDGKTAWRNIRIFASLVLIGAVMAPIFLSDASWPVTARDYLMAQGQAESGAVNLVSAIYLGYRAFDTLGETIVLLIAVTGTLSLLARVESLVSPGPEDTSSPNAKGFSLSLEKRVSHALRTNLLEEVTGKVGPIVLLFGFYVMLYGHLSPGGGFQGGVIIASGIVFLALGNPYEDKSVLVRPAILGGMENIAFLLFILSAMSGVFLGEGFFGNPLAVSGTPEGFIILMNCIIGMKVGSSLAFMCIVMMGGANHD